MKNYCLTRAPRARNDDAKIAGVLGMKDGREEEGLLGGAVLVHDRTGGKGQSRASGRRWGAQNLLGWVLTRKGFAWTLREQGTRSSHLSQGTT
jgi:hypothetical protein